MIFKYSCNVYECPYSQSIKFIPISNVIIPQFSLFGCGDFGSGCVPTVIPKAKYLVMLNFSTESLKKIKDIKVEYQKLTNYWIWNKASKGIPEKYFFNLNKSNKIL